MAGSWSAIMSQSDGRSMLVSVSWAVWDVLRFCCQIRILFNCVGLGCAAIN